MFSNFNFLLSRNKPQIIKLIEGNGGKYSIEYNPAVTHSLMSNEEEDNWKIQIRTFSVPVLKEKFILDSVRNKEVMNFNPYLFIPREFIRSTLNHGFFEGYVFFISGEKGFPSALVGEIVKAGGSIVKTEYIAENMDKLDNFLNHDFQISFFVFSSPIFGYLMSDDVCEKKILKFLMINSVRLVKREWIEECVNRRCRVPFHEPRFEIEKKNIIEMFSLVIDRVKGEMRKSIDPNLNLARFSVTTKVPIDNNYSVNAIVLFRRIYNINELDFLSIRVQFLAFEFIIELMIMSSVFVHDKNFRQKLGEEEFMFILRMIYRSEIIRNVIEFLKKAVRMEERKKKMFFRFTNLLLFNHIRKLEMKVYLLENLLFFLNEVHELKNSHHLIILKIFQSNEFVSTFSHDPSAIDDDTRSRENVVLRFIQRKLCGTRIMEQVMERVFANAVYNVPLVRRILRYKLADSVNNKNILIEILLIQVHKYALFILKNLGKIEKKNAGNATPKKRRKRVSRGGGPPDNLHSRSTSSSAQYDDRRGGDEYHCFLLDILFSKFLYNLPPQLEMMRLTSILYLHLHVFDEKKLLQFDELVFELIGRDRYDISFFENFANRQVLLAKHYFKLMYYTRMRRFKGKDRILIVKKFLQFRKDFEDHFFASKKKGKRNNKRKRKAQGGSGGRAGTTRLQDSSSVIEEIKHKKVFRVDENLVRANVKNSMYPDIGLDIVTITDEQSMIEKENQLSQKYPELYTFEEEEGEEEEEEVDEFNKPIPPPENEKNVDVQQQQRKGRRRRRRRRSVVKKFKTPIIFTEDDFDSKRTFVHMGLKEVVFGLVQNECYKCFTRIHPRMKCGTCDRVMCKVCFNAYIDEEAWEKYLFKESFVCSECENKKRKVDQIYEGGEDDMDHIHKKRKID